MEAKGFIESVLSAEPRERKHPAWQREPWVPWASLIVVCLVIIVACVVFTG